MNGSIPWRTILDEGWDISKVWFCAGMFLHLFEVYEC